MNGKEYEVFCGEYLKKLGFHNIQYTKETGDQGIDIIAYKNHKKYGFQCKYYESPVGNAAVQEAFAGAAYYQCDKACVITNNTFTRSAIQLADETNVELFDEIDKNKNKIIPILFKCIFLVIALLCIYLFNQERVKDVYSSSRILSCIFFLIAYFISINYEKSYLSCILSAIFSLISLSLFIYDPPFNNQYDLYFLFSIFFFHIFMDIQTLMNIYKKHKNYKTTVLLETKQLIHQEIEEYGNSIAKEMSDDFNTHVELNTYTDENKTITYVYYSTKNISKDLSLAEFEYNQKYIDETYTFQKLSPKTFSITIQNSHIYQKESL